MCQCAWRNVAATITAAGPETITLAFTNREPRRLSRELSALFLSFPGSFSSRATRACFLPKAKTDAQPTPLDTRSSSSNKPLSLSLLSGLFPCCFSLGQQGTTLRPGPGHHVRPVPSITSRPVLSITSRPVQASRPGRSKHHVPACPGLHVGCCGGHGYRTAGV